MQHFRVKGTFIVGLLTAMGMFADPLPPDTARNLPESLAVAASVRADTAARATDTIHPATVPLTDSLLFTATVPKSDTSAPRAQQPGPETVTPDTVHTISDTIHRIAVANFFGRGIDASTARAVSDRCRLLLSNYSALPVMGLGEMEDSLIAHTRGDGRLCDHNDCLVAMGGLLGVRYIIGGSAGKIDDLLTLAIRCLDVRTGKVLLFKLLDTRREIGELLAGQLPEIVVEFNNKLRSVNSATIALQSEPPGAGVEFDQTPIGKTPLLLKNVKVGTHDIRLTLERHGEIVDTVTLEKLNINDRRYVLKLTDKAAVAFREKRQALWTIRGVGLLGGIAALSAGLYYDTRLDRVETMQQNIVDEHNAAGNDTDGAFFSERFRHQSMLYERLSAYRNFSLVAAVALAAGVGMTFLF